MAKKKRKKQERAAAKSGGRSRLRAFLAHPLVADVLAAGLIALANALKENRAVREAASKARDKAEHAASEAVHDLGEAGSEAVDFGAILAAKAKEQARRLGASYLGVNGSGGKGGRGPAEDDRA